MDDTQKTVGTLSKEFNKDMDRGREKIRDVAESALEKGRATWKNAMEQGNEALTQAQERGEEAWQDVQTLVRSHPGKSVSIAMLAGAAIGLLLGSRDNRPR